jgi:hypothetical protein
MVWVDRTDGQTGYPRGTIDAVITLRLFAQARESAGTKSVDVAGDTVGDVLDEAVRRFGEPFAAVGSVSPAPAATVTWSEVAPVWHPAGVMAHRPARWRPLLPGAASSASVEVQWTAGAGSAPGRSESETPERYEGPGAAALARR